MDNIYEALKGFLKSIINLFVSVIDLFAGIINGIAFILGKLKPKASKRLNEIGENGFEGRLGGCLLYTSPSPRDRTRSRMPSSA